MITAVAPAPTVRSVRVAAAARIVGAAGVALASAWGIVGIVLFAHTSRGEASALFALDPRDADAALAALGWPGPIVLAVVVTVQTAVLVTTIVAAGFILATRRPTGYTIALAVVIVAFVASASCAVTGWATAVPDSAVFGYYLTALSSVAFLALAPLFPTGTTVPAWSGAIVAAWLILGTLSLVVPWWTLGPVWVIAGSATALALVVATIVAQALRFRRHSERTERQQIKWVLLSLSLYLLSLVPVFAMPPGSIEMMSGPGGIAFQVIRGLVSMVLFAFIAVSIAFAIAKYRLFDVDLVIRRTLVAGALVLLVGLVYVAVVGGAALLWRGSGAVAAVAATIFVAFAAHPVRVRLERGVSRWVYGERGDPYAVVSRLSDELRGLRGTDEIAGFVADVVVRDLRYSGASVGVWTQRGTREFSRGDAAARSVAERSLVHDGEEVGVLVVRAGPGDRLSAANGRLVDAVAAQAALAIGAARAAEEVRESRERILLAREEERRRLYRDLHDGLGPGLAGARQRIETAMSLGDARPEASRRLLDDASAAMADMLADVRGLVHGLRPPALDELGLAEAVLRASRPLDAAGMPALAVGDAPEDLPPAVEVAAYRIAVEAITNASRHARAHTISARFVREEELLVVTVEDDGVGIAGTHAGAGRRSMRERAEELGGRLRVTARHSGGTRVRAELPLALTGEAGS
ncbi:MAG: sensor histidine kinase [Microbacterium sp.]